MNLRYAFNLTRKYLRNFHTTTTRLSTEAASTKRNIKTTLNYFTALGIVVAGGAYAAVPLYRIFCQVTSYGGTTRHDLDGRVESIKPIKDKKITIRFTADKSSTLAWNFKPQQTHLTVSPGETALVFYTAQNPTDKPIIGISSYNVIPFEAGQYFNKIQCFCFEEQQLNPHEEVDMPVFFYVDPEFVEDPFLEGIDEIFLSYTFFEASSGIKIPVPSYIKKHLEKT